MLQFDDLVANRLLCFQNIAHQDNAISLCPTCHSNFDDLNQPGLIFIPTNVEYFIEYEKNDQKRRRETPHIQREGRSICVGRYGVPSPDEYQNNAGGLYTRYYLRRCFPEAMVASVGRFGEPKHWHGSPSAALRRAQLLLGNTVVKGLPKDVRRKLNELASLYLDLDLETDLGQDYEPGFEAAGSPASDGSGSTATGRCTPSTSRPGTRANRKSMGDGKSGGGDSGGFDKEKGPSESYGEQDNRAGAVFGVNEGDSEERACGTVDEGNEVNLDGSHDSSPTIASHPSLIASFTSSLIDTQSHALDPSSEQPWTWGPHSTGQKIIDFVSTKDAIRFDVLGEAGGNTEPLIVDADLEEKHD